MPQVEAVVDVEVEAVCAVCSSDLEITADTLWRGSDIQVVVWPCKDCNKVVDLSED